jgi:hypothetical protein
MVSGTQSIPPIVVSCVLASSAPVVAVIARFRTPPRWTCVLKWWIDDARLEPGAWTKLRLKERRCRVTADGEFLMYVATGPLGGPFSAYFGGAVAVSRVPWLSALTDIVPACVAGGGPSRHALQPKDQARLWDLFQGVPNYYSDDDWPHDLGPAWQRVDPDEFRASELGLSNRRQIALAARTSVPGRAHSLVAVAERGEDGNSSNDRRRFFLQISRAAANRFHPLENFVWAHPHRNGMILAATRDGRLQQLRLQDHADVGHSWHLEQEHDLAGLKPSPRPAPSAATRPL